MSPNSNRPHENITYTITELPNFGQILLNGSSTASFTQADVDAGLVSYEHDGSEDSTPDSFSFIEQDDISGEVSGSFSFTITPVNDEKPAVDLNGDASGRGYMASFTEDNDPVAIVVAGEVSITDADSDSGQIHGATVTLTNNLDAAAEILAVDLGSSGLNSSISYSNGEAVLSISGEASIATYDAVLNTLTYENQSDNLTEAERTLEVTVFDGVNTSDISTILVEVNASNDAPVWTNPASQTAIEETATALPGISLADVDANNGILDVTLSVADGTISLGDTSGLTLVENSGTASIQLQGDLASINNSLATLSYTGDQDFNGVDTLTLFVNDQGNTGGPALTATSTMQIDLSGPESAVNDAPVISAPDSANLTEDNALSFTDISIGDVDAGDDIVRVTITAPDGVLDLPQTTGLNFIQGDGAADGILEFEGTVDDINAALNGLAFTPNQHFNGNTQIQIQVNDQSATAPENQTAEHTIDLEVAAENDAPVWSHPASQAAVEETPTIINGISLADIDAADGDLDVTLTVAHGTLALADTSGLSVVENNGSASIHLQGDLASINNALQQLSYTSEADFNELDELQLFVNDLGNTGGGELTAASTMVVDLSDASVSSVNDAPVITAPAAAVTAEDNNIIFTDISVADVDAADDLVRVNLSVEDGSLTLATTDGLNFARGDGSGDAEVEFEGTLDAVNAALDGLSFTPAANFNGDTQLNITVNDQSDINPGPLSDNHVIDITVTPENDAPNLVVNQPLSVTDPQSPIAITSDLLSGADVDNPDNELHFVLQSLPENGTLSLDGQPLAVGEQFSQADIDNGLLVYTPLNNGALQDGFEFQLCDPELVSAQTTSGVPFQIFYTAPSKAADADFADSNVYHASNDLFNYGGQVNGAGPAPTPQSFGLAQDGLDVARTDHFANALNAIDQAAQAIQDGGILGSGIAGASASGGMASAPSAGNGLAGGNGDDIARSCSEVAGLGGCNLAASDGIESRLSNAQPELLGRYLDAGELTLSGTPLGVQQGLLEPQLMVTAGECNHLNEPASTFANDYQGQQAEGCELPAADAPATAKQESAAS